MNYFKITETKQKISEILAECKKLFPVLSYYDDEGLDKNFPPPKKITTRYFQKNIEADEEYKNMSANDLKDKGVDGITLRERLLMEIDYFKETGKHLDIKNSTLCSGSRSSDGDVPRVHLDSDGKVYVYWCDPSESFDSLRARSAVSLDSSKLSPLENRVKDLETKVEKLLKVIKV